MFETYDLKEFGKHIRKTRLDLGLTQKDINLLSGITADCLRRIETGKVIPRYETIVLLSIAVKKDLLKDLQNYRNSNPLFTFYSSLDELIIKTDEITLSNLNIKYDEIIESENNIYIDNSLTKQFKLLIEGVELFYNKDYKSSICLLIEAIQISNPLFEIKNLNELKFNYFEIRVMLLLANAYSYIDQLDNAKALLMYAIDKIDNSINASAHEKQLFTKLLLNLSYYHHLSDKHQLALNYALDGIKHCNETHSSFCLGLLYYRKAVSMWNLNQYDSKEAFLYADSLLRATDKVELADQLLNNTEKLYNTSDC